MTVQLYQKDSYIKEFDASVLKATPEGIVLDRTAFYPGGGGQPYDLGTLWEGNIAHRVVRTYLHLER